MANTKPYFKAAFQGFAGSGKTYTAALVAVGLYKRIGSTKPVIIFDTEKAAKFLKPLFAENNIPVLVTLRLRELRWGIIGGANQNPKMGSVQVMEETEMGNP